MTRVLQGRTFSTADRRSLANWTMALDSNKFLLTSSLQWYLLLVTKVPGLSVHISVQKWQTLLVDLSQREPYLKVMILNLYSWQKILSNGIQYAYVWSHLPKVTFFEINCKLIVKHCLVLRAGATETWNTDPRPLLNSFRGYKSIGDLRIGKQAFVENSIFWGKSYCLDLCEISITWYLWLYFGNQAYPCTLVDE